MDVIYLIGIFRAQVFSKLLEVTEVTKVSEKVKFTLQGGDRSAQTAVERQRKCQAPQN